MRELQITEGEGIPTRKDDGTHNNATRIKEGVREMLIVFSPMIMRGGEGGGEVE